MDSDTGYANCSSAISNRDCCSSEDINNSRIGSDRTDDNIKKGIPTEKAGRLIQYQEYVYMDVSGNKTYSTSKDASSTLTLILVRYF